MGFAKDLSIATADANTPEPTNGISAISRSPWIVPSSPYGPCNTGKTISIPRDFPATAKPSGDIDTGVPSSGTTGSTPSLIES